MRCNTSANKIARSSRCTNVMKNSAHIRNDDQGLDKTNSSVWLLLLQYHDYIAARSLRYIITPTAWSILNAVNTETKWFLSTHPQVWQGFDINLTMFTLPENCRLMDDLFKYADSVTIMADQLSSSYQTQANLRLRWLQPGIYSYNPQNIFKVPFPIVSDWPLFRNFRYEVCIWWGVTPPQFAIGIVDCNDPELIVLQESMLIEIHSNLPDTITWKINHITVQNVNAKKVLGKDSEEAFLRKNKATVGIEVDETSVKFIWNGQHIDSLLVGQSFISRVATDKFYFFMDTYSTVMEPLDAFLTTNN